MIPHLHRQHQQIKPNNKAGYRNRPANRFSEKNDENKCRIKQYCKKTEDDNRALQSRKRYYIICVAGLSVIELRDPEHSRNYKTNVTDENDFGKEAHLELSD